MKDFIVSGISTPSYRSRCSSAKVQFKPSVVDETLFTKPKINHSVDFEPPWVNSKIRKPPSPINVQALLDKVVSKACQQPNGENEVLSKGRTVPAFRPTVVEEELFGKKQPESSFVPPWEKKEQRPRPLLCSPMNYKERWRLRKPASGSLLHSDSHKWRAINEIQSSLIDGQFTKHNLTTYKQKPRPPWKP